MAVSARTNQDIITMRNQHVPRGVGVVHPIAIARAEGARVWDIEGKEYIDWIGGIGVLNIGHNHPKVMSAVRAQLENMAHICFQVASYEPYVELASRLNQYFPGPGPNKTIFFNSGAEATENSVKIARAYTNRPGVIAFKSSFHGRTLMGMSLTGKSNPYKQNFGPFAPEIYHAPYPYEYRGMTTDRALKALHELFKTTVAADRVAAIIIEPQLGEGGFVAAPKAFMQELRTICSDNGIVFVADEIQSGFGRTGKMFAIEHSDVEPDLITAAKSIAGGMPLSAVMGKAEIMDAPAPGGMGGTYAGAPASCAAGLAVLKVFEEENILEQAQKVGEKLHVAFRNWQEEFPQIGDVRGLGPMTAIELVTDPESKEPATDLAKQVVHTARDKGLLLLWSGLYGNTLRVLVPVTIEDELLDRSLDILHESLQESIN